MKDMKYREVIKTLKGSSLKVKVVVSLVCLYLLCPFDIVPDFIPVIGVLDDILVLSFGIRYIKKHTGIDISL